MKHALFVSFHYPPDGTSSGVWRTLKHTRYLGDHGWRVTVLCPEVSAYDAVDDAMLEQVPASVRIVRTPYRNSKRHFGLRGRYLALSALPDVWIGWLPWALAAGMRVAREDPVDLIYSTSPPSTAHLIGWGLAHRLGRPWVADFRDPWIEDSPEPGAPSGAVYRKIDRWLEQRVVDRCSHCVTTTEPLRALLAGRHAEAAAERITVIPNGYDEADFAGLPTGASGTPRSDRLSIVHAGLINPHFRDPAPLLRALRLAADSGGLDANRVRLRFLGGGGYADSGPLRAAIADTGLAGSVEFVPRMPYADALRELSQADVLLLLQASEDTRGLVPAKLYEYLRMQKPVLALVLAGESSQLIERAGGGVAVDPADPAQLASELAGLYRRWQDGTLDRQHADPAVLQRYERRGLTRELAAIFDRLVDSRPAAVRPA